jgi:group I intron endonuclease
MKTTYIYTLSDPITNEIRYIGKTININIRLSQHIAESMKAKNHKASWIKSLTKKGLLPKIDVIDIIQDENWEWLEIYWISQFKTWGFDLVNSTTGGGKSIFNENARNNMRLGQLGKKRSKESIEKRIKKTTGLKRSEEFKEKARLRKTGTFHSNETKRKLSIKRKNRIISETQKEKVRIKIKQLDLDGNLIKIWSSISEAKKEFPFAKISECIHNKRKQSYGYKWEKI